MSKATRMTDELNLAVSQIGSALSMAKRLILDLPDSSQKAGLLDLVENELDAGHRGARVACTDIKRAIEKI